MADRRPLPTVDKPIPFPPIINDNTLRAVNESHSIERAPVDRPNPTHRRTISGSILSKLSLLRTNSGSERSSTLGKVDDGEDTPPLGGSLALVQQNVKARRRKGSLRKTALLGKGMLGRDRKGSETKLKSRLSSPQLSGEDDKTLALATQETDTDVTPRPSQDDYSPTIPVSPPNWTFPTSKESLSSIRSSVTSVEPASSRASITSPTLPTDHSTTDDDDQALSFTKLPLATRKSLSSSGDSYFPPQPPFRATRPTDRTKSPLATQPQSLTSSPVASEEEWDYSETAYWGYVILIITWLVFVVGMGSCFDVWSWAWDVGETPYAPPELNDDPTLPIVGYYPALIVLSSVMAWVWVVVAWVGMKYFRHAEVRGDDG